MSAGRMPRRGSAAKRAGAEVPAGAVAPLSRAGILRDVLRTRTRHAPIWVVAIVLASLGAGGVAHAVWTADNATPAGVIVTGNLALGGADALTWIETTPGVAVPQSGAGAASLDAYIGMPGDSVEIRYPADTTLEGDNISGRLTVDLTGALPAGLSITGFRILDSTGTIVLAPASGYAPLGSLPEAAALTEAGALDLLVAIEVAWTGADTYVDPTAPAPPPLTALPLEITLQQVRTGPGFTP